MTNHKPQTTKNKEQTANINYNKQEQKTKSKLQALHNTQSMTKDNRKLTIKNDKPQTTRDKQ